MHLEQNKPVFVRHPVTGVKTWFNQVYNHNNTHENSMPRFIGADIPDDKMPRHTLYGNGRLNQKCCNICGHLRATAWACAVGFKWQRGDLLALDNLTVLHGRLGFTGDRKILVYLNV